VIANSPVKFLVGLSTRRGRQTTALAVVDDKAIHAVRKVGLIALNDALQNHAWRDPGAAQ